MVAEETQIREAAIAVALAKAKAAGKEKEVAEGNKEN